VGRLGDLGAINSEFDVAITTCCPQLNHFVVEVIFNDWLIIDDGGCLTMHKLVER